ncbi:MAG: hypothetical protein ACE5JF_10470 [Anaerolineales bacterium]
MSQSILLLLRIIHIVGGAFWVGSAFLLTRFVAPAVAMAGPEGAKFMQTLVLKTRYIVTIAAAAGLTVLAGLILYFNKLGAFNDFNIDWLSTTQGIIFTIGTLVGISAFVAGFLLGSNSRQLAELGASLEGPPSSEQAAEIAGFQNRLANLGAITSILLLVTLISMAIAQSF